MTFGGEIVNFKHRKYRKTSDLDKIYWTYCKPPFMM